MAKIDFQVDFQPDFQVDFQEDEKKGAAKAPTRKSTIKEDFMSSLGQVGNTVDRAWTGGALALQRLFQGPNDAGDEMYQNLQERIRQRNEMTVVPDEAEQGVSGKVTGALSTLPAQMLTFPLSPFQTGQQMLEQGENRGRATYGTVIDTMGNMAGAAVAPFGGTVGKVVTGAAINAAQDAGTKKLIQAVSEKEETKKLFEPTWEDAATSAVVGGGLGALPSKQKTNPKFKAQEEALAKVRAAMAEKKAAETPKVEANKLPDVIPMTPDGLGILLPEHAEWRNRYLQTIKELKESNNTAQAKLLEDAIRQQDYDRAQRIIDQREEDLANEVAQRGGLEWNAAERKRQEQAPTGYSEWSVDQAAREAQDTYNFVKDLKQDAIVEDYGNNDPMSRMPNMRYDHFQNEQRNTPFDPNIDENGMPIRADLSMEAQNLQNPLQRNLWGDELGPALDQTKSLTEAIDSMPKGIQRNIGLKQLGKNQNPLEGFNLPDKPNSGSGDASLRPKTKNKFKSSSRFGGNQRGAINLPDILDAFRNGKSDFDILQAFRGTFTDSQMDLLERYMRSPNSQTAVVLMEPSIFHQLASRRADDGKGLLSKFQRQQIRKYLQSPEGLSDVPLLFVDKNGLIVGHDGRHRMDVFQEQGIPKVPVQLLNVDEAATPNKLAPEDSANFSDTGRAALSIDTPKPIVPAQQITAPKGQRGAVDIEAILRNHPEEDVKTQSVPRSQRGAINMSWIPDDPDVGAAIEQSKQLGKDAKFNATRLIESGSTLAAKIRNSPIIEAASRLLQNADKRADAQIHSYVIPFEQVFHHLDDAEVHGLWNLFKDEMLNRQKYDGEALIAAGFSERQLEAYATMRKMFEEALNTTNDGRLSKGQPPITPQEFYVSSRWEGDFKQPVYDQNGDLVYYLSGKTKLGLNKQIKALKAQFPEFVIDPKKAHVTRDSAKNSLRLDYSTMLDIVGRDSDAAQKIQKWHEEQTVTEGSAAYAQEKHFQPKGNTRGFVGDRPGFDPVKDARAAFEQQATYAKNAFKWGELQKAAEEIKKITSDKDLVAQQPNNVGYVQELFKAYIGAGQYKWVDNLGDGLRQFGVSPNSLDKGVGNAKSFFILQKLAVSSGFILSNLLQVVNMLPHMYDKTSPAYTRNPLTPLATSSLGVLTGIHAAAGHLLEKHSSMDFESYLRKLPFDGDFLADAFKYAEANGVTARSISDESPINVSNKTVSDITKIAGASLVLPETFVRAMAFMSLAYQLRQADKISDTKTLLQKAEEITNMSMVDYRAGERPMIFNKLGSLGNFMNVLQTYPMNFYNQWRYFTQQAFKGNPGPFIAATLVQGGVAGLMGLPLFQDIDKGWEWLKEQLPSEWWAKVKDKDLKLWVLENGDSLSKLALTGAVSELSGVSMTSRLSSPAISEMTMNPFSAVGDLFDQATSVAKAAGSGFTNPTKNAQALMKVAPVALQGPLETTLLKDQTSSLNERTGQRGYFKASDLERRDLGYVRDAKEELLRKTLGLRSQKEVLEREITYRTKKPTRDVLDRSRDIHQKFYDAVRNGNAERAKELETLYINLTGKSFDHRQIDQDIRQEFMTEYQRLASKQGELTPQELIQLAKMKKILNK